jgi:type IV pilus assembly protein PilA
MGSLSIVITERQTLMLATLRKRFDREDEGFTLIELMVVVLIIAILLAIAIPTFLGARERANDRAAQSSLRNALTAAKTIYTDSQDYAAADTSAEMSAVEPSLTYDTAASDDFKVVSVDTKDTSTVADGIDEEWAGAAMSKSGVCFYIHETATGTKFGKDDTSSAGTNCTGTKALDAAEDKF